MRKAPNRGSVRRLLQHGGSFRKYPSRKNIGCGRWLDRNRNTTFSPKFVTFPMFVQVSRCWGLLPLLIVSDFPSVGRASPSLVFWQKQPAWPFRMKVVPMLNTSISPPPTAMASGGKSATHISHSTWNMPSTTKKLKKTLKTAGVD